MAEEPVSAHSQWLVKLLRLRVWLTERLRPSELQVTLFWAGVIGFLAACSSILFRHATDAMRWLFTQESGGYVEIFSRLPAWQRLAIPIVGGALAGFSMLLSVWTSRRRTSTDYMEAVVLGDGIIPARLSLVKSLSALFSISSGGSIGREGPLVQLAAMIASLIGRLQRMSTVRLRLLVACGAAAGIASAYNAPIGGALFVAEIVLQSVAMESFGPLVFASVIATLTTHHFLGGRPLYAVPVLELNSPWEIVLHFLLGIVAGVCGPFFLRFLRWSERAFSKLRWPHYARLALGGAIVGALAIVHPEVCGNGYSVVNDILRGDVFWQTLIAITLFKIIATASTFGSGAVGGVFTPTLFVGASLGYLFAGLAGRVWPGPPIVGTAMTLVGMGAFLSATTHAPLMAIILMFELTLDYQIVLPLMLACVVAHYLSRSIVEQSIYSESLQRKGAGRFRRRLAFLTIGELMRPGPPTVAETARFPEIAQHFITHRFNFLYVTDAEGRFAGAISLHDVKPYLQDAELARLVIARDLLVIGFPTIHPDRTLEEALTQFAGHHGERLPVVRPSDQKLLGALSKTDVLLALAERTPQP